MLLYRIVILVLFVVWIAGWLHNMHEEQKFFDDIKE
jgi:hypothetical protein